MAGQCCTGEGPLRRLARKLFEAVAPILPGTALVLLPKCPVCLAAWLTVTTGLGVSAAAAASVRALIIVSSIAAVALAVANLLKNERLTSRK